MLPARFRHKSSDDQASAISTAILALVASGTAVTRADLARALKVSASTVTLKVSELVASGIVEDAGPGDPTGGRPAPVPADPDAGVEFTVRDGVEFVHVLDPAAGPVDLPERLQGRSVRWLGITGSAGLTGTSLDVPDALRGSPVAVAEVTR